MSYKKHLAETERAPDGFFAIGAVDHPTRNEPGLLIRNRSTGVYAMLIGGVMVSVPHKWAANYASGIGMGADAIQDTCIARMTALGLNPHQLAEMLDGKVSRSHVCDYLTRR